MSLPRPADVPALATRATLPEVTSPGMISIPPEVVGLPSGRGRPRGRFVVVDPGDATRGFVMTREPDPEEAERLATWDRVLP